MEIEFLDWYSKNEDRFAHGQFDEKQIAYSAWLDGKKRGDKAENLPISDVSDQRELLIDLIKYVVDFDSQINGSPESIVDEYISSR